MEPDEAEQELQFALNKARKLKQKEVHINPVEKLAKEIIEGGSGLVILTLFFAPDP